jgi:uroporphyrinogen-III synthase
MHVLITRPEPDAAELAAQIEALGHKVSIEPLLQIEPMPIKADQFAGVQAIIATSRNGLRALAASEALPAALELPIFTVGPDTGEFARALGFRRVIAGAGAARDLVPLIAANADRAKGALVHVAGETVAFDVAAALAAHGIVVRKATAYRAEAARSLSPRTAQMIAEGTIDAVILMSPRTASIFAQLVAAAGLGERARRLTCLCLSRGVAQGLRDLAPVRVEIAPEPNAAGMLAALARVASQSTGV